LREAIRWGDTQLKVHLARLAELEYLIVHRTAQGFAYELVYDGEGADGKAFVLGLIDTETLRYAYDAERSGPNAARSGRGRGPVGVQSVPGRTAESLAMPRDESDSGNSSANAAKTHLSRGNGKRTSYPHDDVVAADDPVALVASPLAADRA
jgi:hypothetical protein